MFYDHFYSQLKRRQYRIWFLLCLHQVSQCTAALYLHSGCCMLRVKCIRHRPLHPALSPQQSRPQNTIQVSILWSWDTGRYSCSAAVLHAVTCNNSLQSAWSLQSNNPLNNGSHGFLLEIIRQTQSISSKNSGCWGEWRRDLRINEMWNLISIKENSVLMRLINLVYGERGY